jgi:transposase
VIEVDGAHWSSSAEREMLRLRVVAALETGKVEGCRQAAGVFGVSERSVGTWWRACRRDGRDGLATRGGRPGPAEPISAEGRGTLFVAMADYTPEELLIGGPSWARPAVVELIRPVVGDDITEQGVGLWLRRHGSTPQRPARRACEQQPATVRAWLDEHYPAVGTEAKAQGSAINSSSGAFGSRRDHRYRPTL